jgi:hypothetical protein
MKHKKLHTLLFAICCGCTSIIFAQAPTNLLELKKGQKLQIGNEVKTITSMEMMGQPMEITINATTSSEAEVKDKKDTSYLLNSTVKRVTLNGNMMGQPLTFDSDKKEDLEGDMGKGFKDLINVPKEIEISNHAKLIASPKKDEVKQADAAAGPDMMNMMKGLTGAENDDSYGATTAFSLIPSGAKTGDTWSDSTITDGDKVRRTYTVKEVNGKEAKVQLSGTQTSTKKVEQMGMEVTITMENKLSGEATIDITTGILKQKTYIVDGTGFSEMMGQNIPMTIKTTTTTTVTSL